MAGPSQRGALRGSWRGARSLPVSSSRPARTTKRACGSSTSPCVASPRRHRQRAPRGTGSKTEIRPSVWKLTVTSGRYTDGRVRRLHRTVQADTEIEATRELAAFVAEVRRDPLPQRRQDRDVTVDEAIEQFLVEHLLGEKGREPRTVDGQRPGLRPGPAISGPDRTGIHRDRPAQRPGSPEQRRAVPVCVPVHAGRPVRGPGRFISVTPRRPGHCPGLVPGPPGVAAGRYTGHPTTPADSRAASMQQPLADSPSRINTSPATTHHRVEPVKSRENHDVAIGPRGSRGQPRPARCSHSCPPTHHGPRGAPSAR
jgi:hypothetical protein